MPNTEPATETNTDEVVVEHRWPFSFQEIAIITALVVIPAVMAVKKPWALMYLLPACVVLAAFLGWLGYSRKHRSVVRLVLGSDSLRIEWPHTKVAKRARPVTVPYDQILSATLATSSGRPTNELAISYGPDEINDKRALIPLRVITPEVAEMLLLDEVVTPASKSAYDKLTGIARRGTDAEAADGEPGVDAAAADEQD